MIFSKKLKCFLFAATIILVGLELFARLCLGLGAPPLYIAHPTIEYLFKPNQDLVRFGNRVLINGYGMRTPNFPAHKQNRNEHRIMVYGDSVLNGGAQTDHDKLATSILSRELSKISHTPVVVGNISAGSWGPGNWMAYALEYGFFDADTLVLVMSSHDTADNPTFAPLNPYTHPTDRPLSAVYEGISRYLPRYLPALLPLAEEPEKTVVSEDTKAEAMGLGDLRAFLSLGLVQTPRVWVLLWPTQKELAAGHRASGWEHATALCAELEIPCLSLWEPVQAALANGEKPFRDNIHPNAEGQKLIAAVLLEAVQKAWPKNSGQSE
jgi:hypothetical protein